MPDKEILRICFFPHGGWSKDIFRPMMFPGYRVLFDCSDPDIILPDTGQNLRFYHYDLLKQVIRARRRFGWRPLLCADHMESAPLPAARNMDYLFSFEPTGGKNFQRVLLNEWEQMERRLSERAPVQAQDPLSRQKTRFCNFIYSSRRYSSAKVREHFCRLLTRYKRVDCPGRSLNNAPPIEPRPSSRTFCRSHPGRNPDDAPQARRALQSKLDFMASCKFTIAFENTSADCYLSEKIFHALSAGSVPIYWGCPGIAEYINPDCFINCHDFRSFAEVVERVKEIDQDPALYAKYRQAPPVLPDSRLHEVKAEMMRGARMIAEEALKRRYRESGRLTFPQLALLFMRNADLLIKDAFLISRKNRLAAVRNLLSFYRRELFSGIRERRSRGRAL